MSNKYATIQKTLVIVESPAKCKKIEEYLGPGYKCMASYGHLRELNTLKNINISETPIPRFTPQFTIIDNAIKKKHIEVLRKEIANSREIILATDDDREGEAIAWHICMLFKLNPDSTKRIIFHEITKSAIEQSMRNPSTINMNIVYAQQARQMIDLFVGFHISPLLWKYIAYNSKNALSAGRCQTPALRLLYDNEKEIRKNPGTKAYKITGYFTNQCIPFELNQDIPTAPPTTPQQEEPVLDFLEYSANNANNHIYTRTNPERTFKLPPCPFTTSRLQQVSSNELHVSPKETMKICQKLYEAGYITYMRTDSNKYSGEFIETAKEYILQKYDDKYLNPNINMHLLGEDNTLTTQTQPQPQPQPKKSKQQPKTKVKAKTNPNETIGGAHEAIRPTNIKMPQIDSDKFSPREKKMYKLIWRNTLQSCMSNAEYYSFTAKIQIQSGATTNNQNPQKPQNTTPHHYKYHTEQLIFPGWKIADPGFSPTQPSQSEKHYVYLLHLPINTPVLYKKITATLTIKNQKQHYTEAKLIQLLEEKGIGRPSTFSMLIDKIQEKEYAVKQDVKGQTIECKDYEIEYDDRTHTPSDIYEIETSREIGNEKSKLVIQPLGMIVLDFLENHFLSLFDYDFTGRMENDLDKVAKGEKNYNEVCKECLDVITDLVDFTAEPLPQTTEPTKHTKPKSIMKPTKIEYKIDDKHYYIIGKNGPVIKCVHPGTTPPTQELLSTPDKAKRGRKPKPKEQITFLSIRKDLQLDIEKLKRGEYKLVDLVDANTIANANNNNNNNNNNNTNTNTKPNENNLGKWEASTQPNQHHDIIIKSGKYGTYAVCGEMKKSLACFGNRPISNITLEEVVPILFDTGNPLYKPPTNPQSKIVRQITENLSIRDGKYGNYIFYKTQKMKKPRFISLTGFKGNIQEETEDNVKKWIRENCHIDV